MNPHKLTLLVVGSLLNSGSSVTASQFTVSHGLNDGDGSLRASLQSGATVVGVPNTITISAPHL